MLEASNNKVTMPLFLGSRENLSIRFERFLGSATIVNGHICTCKHVVEGHDGLFIGLDTSTREPIVFASPKCHSRFDFALLPTLPERKFEHIPVYPHVLHSALSVFSTGFQLDKSTTPPSDLGEIYVTPRTFMGNIVRMAPGPTNVARSISELSFPTLSGLSGAPVITTSPSPHLIGMVYGNAESHITVFSRTEVREGVTTYLEKVDRLVEYGMFHTICDILAMIDDLNEVELTD